MEANDVLCVDVGDVTLWASLSACLTKGQRTLSSERLGTMGYGVCAGIAASLIRAGEGRAVVVAGDGGVQMTINELGTAQHLYAHSAKERTGLKEQGLHRMTSVTCPLCSVKFDLKVIQIMD